MLVDAFQKRLTYNIGRSLTYNTDNCTVWNIHHKTALEGGAENHGYPDPTYFKRVTEELANYGIFPQDFQNVEIEITKGMVEVSGKYGIVKSK